MEELFRKPVKRIKEKHCHYCDRPAASQCTKMIKCWDGKNEFWDRCNRWVCNTHGRGGVCLGHQS